MNTMSIRGAMLSSTPLRVLRRALLMVCMSDPLKGWIAFKLSQVPV
jgi:hypothetical protein